MPSTLKPEEREFVADSLASMLMISKEDLNHAEMDTLTKSCSPSTVIAANGEVQTHEEATVYVKELDIVDSESPRGYASILSLGKLLRWKRIFLWIDQRSKPHLINNGIRIQCNTENFIPIVVPGLSTCSSSSLPSSTSMTPSRREIDHPTSTSSFSTSPTMTSSTVFKRQWDWSTWRPVWDRFTSSICVK